MNHDAARRDSEALWDWNLETNRIHFSPRWIALAGYQDQEIGTSPDDWFDRVHPEDSKQLRSGIEAAQRDGSDEFELRYRLRHKNGNYRWMSCRGLVVRDDAGSAIRVMGSQSDVTVETVTDHSTGLPNQLLLLDRLTQSVDRATRYKGYHFALLLIDVGRPSGPTDLAAADPLLVAVARRLETCLRIPDRTPSLRHNDLVARLEADCFAVLVDGLNDVSHAKGVGDRILGELLNPFALRGREIRLSPSVGIAVSATGYTHADDVLRDAETALRRAQVLGGSHCEVFDTGILKSEQVELQLEGDLEAALERGEFELYYQPIVSLASNRVTGFEALVRWQHPILGMIAPLDFIPIAERTGFIVPLGEWIVRRACQQLQTWQTSSPHSANLWMSVNLSSIQLQHAGLLDQVKQALRAAAIAPRSLVLEITEGVAMENPTAAKTVLMQLRAMGVRISIDDFGTGYSSLAYLRQLPVDTLKVDRSFVRGMETNKDIADIVRSLTAMAQQLGLDVVVEGIENRDQLALLRTLHCKAAQGYLFAKPLDAKAASGLLETELPIARQDVRVAAAVRGGSHPERATPPARLAAIAAAVVILIFAALVSIFKGPGATAASTPVSVAADIALPADPPDESPVAKKMGSGVIFRGQSSDSKKPAAESLPLDQPADAVSSRAEPSTPTGPPQNAAAPASVEAVHLHRIGSCRGRLTVSSTGVSFVPDEGEDVFEFAYREFLHTLAEDTLTIRSATRTYRFKSLDHTAGGTGLRDIVASIVRHR